MEREELETLIASLGSVDHDRVDWKEVRWTAYLIHQHLRYDYPGTIRDLRQRLVLVPPERHGAQRLIIHKLEVSQPADVRSERDRWGNLVMHLSVDRVERAIDFTAWLVIERDAAAGDAVSLGVEQYRDPVYWNPSPLTAPDKGIRDVAARLRADGGDAAEIAARTNNWVHEYMSYVPNVTGVRTTAARAFELRRGVCQDYAHLMLAILREIGVPARYVSGHLLGEGGTHAWVEVLLPRPGRPGEYVAQPYDPTHGNLPGPSHITVAVGRDYGDVAPTSGTFVAPHGGRLSARKRAGVTALEYHPSGA